MRRICPLPPVWAQIHSSLLKHSSQKNCEPKEPPKPLILAGWNFSDDEQKARRWRETIEWAKDNGYDNIMNEISDRGWYQIQKIGHQGTDEQSVSKEGNKRASPSQQGAPIVLENEDNMEFCYDEVIHEIKTNGFLWTSFEKTFPFGFLKIREGQYVQLLNAVLDALPDDRQRCTLLNLVDAQWCIFIEQIWIAREFSSDPNLLLGENHFALARLQIGSNIRAERNFKYANGRKAMMSLGENDTLFGRIVR